MEESLDSFFRAQRARIQQNTNAAIKRVAWARQTGTLPGKHHKKMGVLGLGDEYDVELMVGSIDRTSAIGPKRLTLSQMDGERE